jgi:hypothetical protein
VTYSPDLDGPGGNPGNDFDIDAFNLADGECAHIATAGFPVTATIVETPGAGSHLESIDVAYAGGNVTPEDTDVATATAIVTFGEDPSGQGVDPGPSGVTVTFTNELDPPPGDEGCTPGYWKQEQHFDSWPGIYTPTGGGATTLNDVFGRGGSTTLLAALNGGGGAGVAGALSILYRAAAAAVLNSESSVAYPRTTADIVSDVQTAVDSNNRATILALASALDADNNLGCPLN